MSATLIPTKTAGERPPILPPVTTTFDGAGGDDSWIERMTDEVRRVCRYADAASVEEMEGMIEMLDLRRSLVIQETMLHNSLGDYSLPPISNIPIDFLLSPSREQRMLQGLLNQLEECRARCERRLARFRFEARLSQDLGTSES